MIIGVPKEIKSEEYRVGLTPASAQEIITHGNRVLIEHNAGLAVGFDDAAYRNVGAEIVEHANGIYAQSEMIVKVKEPQPSEYELLREGQILFTFLHLAPDLPQTEALCKSGCIAIAYETVTSKEGTLPLLAPMSQVAGRLSIQVGSHCLEKLQGGSGILLGGVPGVFPGKVVIIGGGVVGTHAMRMAMGKQAIVTVLDKSLHRLQELDMQFDGRLNTVYASEANIREYVADADLVIGAVLVPGKAAPKIVPRDLLKEMRPGSVMVDVSIDQGGCFETSKPTTHAHPTYIVDHIVHYCVSNMPGAVPRTSTLALNNATLPFILRIVDRGLKTAMIEDSHLMNGLNVYQGHITHEGVAKDLGKPYFSPMQLITR